MVCSMSTRDEGTGRTGACQSHSVMNGIGSWSVNW